MTLLIDVGNARIKWCQVFENQLSHGVPFFYKGTDFEALLDEHFGPIETQVVAISNVGGKIYREKLTAWFEREKGVTPDFYFAESSAFGLEFAYHTPRAFGMDRFFAMLYCWQHFKSPFVLLGCGSATTFDAVNEAGRHLGSLIAPGLYLQHASMANLANCEVPADLSVSQFAYGKSTAEAISQGAIQLIADFFNARYRVFQHEIDSPVKCVITGGDALRIQPFLTMPSEHVPHCVLLGMAHYMEKGFAKKG